MLVQIYESSSRPRPNAAIETPTSTQIVRKLLHDLNSMSKIDSVNWREDLQGRNVVDAGRLRFREYFKCSRAIFIHRSERRRVSSENAVLPPSRHIRFEFLGRERARTPELSPECSPLLCSLRSCRGGNNSNVSLELVIRQSRVKDDRITVTHRDAEVYRWNATRLYWRHILLRGIVKRRVSDLCKANRDELHCARDFRFESQSFEVVRRAAAFRSPRLAELFGKFGKWTGVFWMD